jgi:(R,R)-butanediol dehydrogenase/meso-butanediol dehydrogenase/diacetyl reductase
VNWLSREVASSQRSNDSSTEDRSWQSCVVYSAQAVVNSRECVGSLFREPRVWLESRNLGRLKPGWLRLRMLRVGLCGTDLHLMETAEDGRIRCTSPLSIPPEGRLIGHEGVGRVEAVGSGVHHVQPGDVVCCESIISCGVCVPCRRGHFNQCERAELLGLQTDGLFADRVDLPAGLAHRVNDLAESVAGRDGLACVEPAAVAFLACQNARLAPGEAVLVQGGGPIGYLTALLARTVFGAGHVCVSEPGAYRREHARSVADITVTPSELHGLEREFDVLIEASGALGGVDRQLEVMRPNGRVVLLARTGTPLEITRVDAMITRSLSIMGSRGHLGGAFDAILGLLRSGRLELRQVVTQVVPGLSGLKVALENPGSIAARECKVIADLEEAGT